MTTNQIEDALRQAPRPKPPAGLKEQLVAQVPLSEAHSSRRGEEADDRGYPPVPGSWLRRWWPALASATIFAACAAVFGLQQLEIRDLKQSIEVLARARAGESAASLPASDTPSTGRTVVPALTAQEEIARLKEQAAKLAAEVSRLQQLQAENQKLRSQLSAASGTFLTPEETAGLEDARQRAMSIQCVNNLKQLGLAVRVWALDNGDMSPPTLLQMTNEMSTPKILVCPADAGRKAADNWAAYSSANCSYEYLAPASPGPVAESQRLLFRCPIHGNIGLMDGSVQMEVAKKHPDWIVQKNGKLYLKANE